MPGTEHRNLILVTVDAWRTDFTGTHAGIPLLPSLAGAARHTVRCERFYADAPWTTPALLSILTGESPARHRVFHQWSAPRENSPGLALRMGEAGYTMPDLCYLNGIQGYQNLGFDPRKAPQAAHSPQDDSLLRSLREHRDRRTPFFLWYHYKHLHLPYWAAESCRRRMGIEDDALPQRLLESVCSQFVVPREQYRLLPEDRDLVRRLYAAGVLELNDFLQPLFEELDRGDLLDRTTFVLTADHGEELLDHEHVGHASTSHHATLHEEVLHIPLFIADGRLQGPASLAARMQGMDLHSTLLSLIGLEVAAGPGTFDFSRAILDPRAPLPAEDRIFYFHSARMGFRTPPEKEAQIVEGISDGRMKFIAEHFDTPQHMLYDLEADPGEHRPRILPGDSDTERLQDRLAKVRAELG